MFGVFSSIGRASISALRAIAYTFEFDLISLDPVPWMSTTRPVKAIDIMDDSGMPKLFKVYLIFSRVLNS